MIYREDGGSKDLWNTRKYMPVYRISHPRQEPSPTPMWEPQTPPIWACLILLTDKTGSTHVIKLHITISPDNMDFLNRVLYQEFLYRVLHNLVSLVPCCFLWPLTDEPCLKILHKSTGLTVTSWQLKRLVLQTCLSTCTICKHCQFFFSKYITRKMNGSTEVPKIHHHNLWK